MYPILVYLMFHLISRLSYTSRVQVKIPNPEQINVRGYRRNMVARYGRLLTSGRYLVIKSVFMYS